MATSDLTGVRVKTGFFPLAYYLHLCTPRIEIDGCIHKKRWGTHFFALAPGTHKITIYFRYLLMSRCGSNFVSVNVTAGEITNVCYNMPPWMLARGTISVS